MSERGFSLLELLVALAVTSIMVLIMGQFIGKVLANLARQQTITIIQNNTKQAVLTTSDTIRSARGVEASNSLADQHAPGAPSNLYSWSAASGDNATLILAVPAHNTSGNILYIDGQHNTPYVNDVIYFIDPTTRILYRRTLANPGAPGNTAITTCPPSAVTASCPADAKVVEDVADLVTQYYDASNNPVTSPSGTEAVKVTLKQTKTSGGQTLTSSFTTIASLRNK